MEDLSERCDGHILEIWCQKINSEMYNQYFQHLLIYVSNYLWTHNADCCQNSLFFMV